MTPERILLSIAVAGVAAWTMLNWRSGVRLALVMLVFEGAVRKWVLPGAQDLVYFAKDVVLLGCYAGFFLRDRALARRARIPSAVSALLGVSAAYGVLAIANPGLPSPLSGLLGFKSYFLYAPLIFMVPSMFGSDRTLMRFLERYCLLAIPIGLLAAVQFRSPSASAINTYAWNPGDVSDVITFGTSSQARVTGTFSFISGYAVYTLVVTLLVMALLAARQWRFRGNVPLFASLALALVGMLMTGSRAPVVQLACLVPIYLWYTVVKARGGGRALSRVLAVVGLGSLVAMQAFLPAAEAFFQRAQTSEDTLSRIASPLLDPYRAFEVGGLMGEGIGLTHQAASRFAGGGIDTLAGTAGLRTGSFESESGRVMIELGLFGFLLFYGLRVVLLLFAFRSVAVLRHPPLQGLGTASLMIMLVALPGAIVFNVTQGLYFWFASGLLFAVARLDRLRSAQADVGKARGAAAQAKQGLALTSRSAWEGRVGI